VIGQLHALAALPLEKESLLPIGYEVGWAPEPVRTLWSKEKSLAPAGTRTPAVQPVAIPTDLSQLQINITIVTY
jgi:hypothetical protein